MGRKEVISKRTDFDQPGLKSHILAYSLQVSLPHEQFSGTLEDPRKMVNPAGIV